MNYVGKKITSFSNEAVPAREMTKFDAIFEVNSSIGKLWDLLGHFDKKIFGCDFDKSLLNDFF